MATGSGRLTVRLSASLARAFDGDLVTVVDGVRAFYARCGLRRTHEVEVAVLDDEPFLAVLLDDEPLALSLRRRAAHLAAAAGPCPDLAWLLTADGARSWLTCAPPERQRWGVRSLVEVTLHASLAQLVRRDVEGLVPAGEVDALVRAVELAAELGLTPRDLGVVLSSAGVAEARVELSAGDLLMTALDGRDPFVLCEALLRRASVAGLTLAAAPPTLRRLTLGPRALRPADFTQPFGVSPRGLHDRLFERQGITIPAVTLAMQDDLPEDVLLLRFGAEDATPVPVLPSGTVAVSPRDALWTEERAGYVLHPGSGESWAVVHRSAEEPYRPSSATPTRFVLEHAVTEARCRSGRFVRDGFPWQWRGEARWRLADHAPPVRRWLLADGVSVQYQELVDEAVARALTGGHVLVEEVLETARRELAGAVLAGQLPNGAPRVVDLAEDLARQALHQDSARPILLEHELDREVKDTVVVCTDALRPMVQRLLRPLQDLVTVVGAQEVAGVPMTVPEHVGDPLTLRPLTSVRP